MEGLNLGSAAGAEPIVLGESCSLSLGCVGTAMPKLTTWKGERKKDQEWEEIQAFIKTSYFKVVQLKCSPLV